MFRPPAASLAVLTVYLLAWTHALVGLSMLERPVAAADSGESASGCGCACTLSGDCVASACCCRASEPDRQAPLPSRIGTPLCDRVPGDGATPASPLRPHVTTSSSISLPEPAIAFGFALRGSVPSEIAPEPPLRVPIGAFAGPAPVPSTAR